MCANLENSFSISPRPPPRLPLLQGQESGEGGDSKKQSEPDNRGRHPGSLKDTLKITSAVIAIESLSIDILQQHFKFYESLCEGVNSEKWRGRTNKGCQVTQMFPNMSLLFWKSGLF